MSLSKNHYPLSIIRYPLFCRFLLVRFGFGRKDRRNERAIGVVDLDVGIAAQCHKIFFAFFGNDLVSHCFANFRFVKKGFLAGFFAVVNAEDLDAFDHFHRLGDAADFGRGDRREKFFAMQRAEAG